MSCRMTVHAVMTAAAVLLVSSAPSAEAQYLPYYYGYYGWGGYPLGEHDANMREATRERQANLQEVTQRTTQVRQMYNRGLVENARRNSAWTEEESKSVAEWRLRQTQQTVAQRTGPPAGFAPAPAAAPAARPRSTDLVVKWPTILKEPSFEGPRTRLENLAQQIKPLKNGLSSADYERFATEIAQMRATLKQMAPQLNAAEYQLVEQFLASLLHELRGAVKPGR